MDIKLNLRDVSVTVEEVEEFVRRRTTIETLATELRRRGCVVYYPDEIASTAETQIAVDEASMDFDKWMRLGIEMDRINHYSEQAKIGILQYVVGSLLDLLQPPSVREARATAGEA